jgi:hypothetical protein
MLAGDVEGHGFSRAAEVPRAFGVLAPEVRRRGRPRELDIL